MRSSSSAAPRAEPRSPILVARPSAPPRELARAALGPLEGADVLVVSDDPLLFGAGLAQEGARVTALTLGPTPPGRPDAWRSTDLPSWHFDALLADRLLTSANDLDALLYRLRTWVRPDAPFALVEPVAPATWDARARAAAPVLSPGDLDIVRRHLPGVRVTRLPPADAVTSWTDALLTAVEPWIPALARDVRVAVLSGRLPP